MINNGLLRNFRPHLESVETPGGLSINEVSFALNLLQGFPTTEAYRQAFAVKAKKLTVAQISRAAYKLKQKPAVHSYLQALATELEQAAVATALDLQMFLSSAIFTPIADIDEHHPLCQKCKRRTIHTDGGVIEEVDIETVNKMDAAKTLIRMKGLDAPIKVDVNHSVGVMIVPMASSVDDWEKAAAKSQAALMEDAMDI